MQQLYQRITYISRPDPKSKVIDALGLRLRAEAALDGKLRKEPKRLPKKALQRMTYSHR
jgi:hypothetical protein